MKKYCILFVIFASLLMSGCLKDEKFATKTTFTGRVLDSYNNTPKANCQISIANDPIYYAIATTYTDANGYFSLTLDYKSVPDHDFTELHTEYKNRNNKKYLYVGTHQYPLMGLGQETYDYGTIIY